MEINISALKTVDMWPVSGSVATHGTNAGTKTFEAAKNAATNCLDTPEKLEAFRAYLQNCGMDETENMTKEDLNAMLLQAVSIELRENGFKNLEDMHDTRGPEEYSSMNVFFGTDGEYYLYAGI